MKNRIMIDIETLGQQPGSVITSIGAVRFNHEHTLDEFSVCVDPVSCEDAGLRLDAQTVMWWFDQSQDARSAWMAQDTVKLEYALMELREWIVRSGDDIEIWGNGANFDPVLLESAFRVARIDVPWKFWQVRCFRTIKCLLPWTELRVFPQVEHDSIEDARAQAKWLLNIEHQFRQRGLLPEPLLEGV